MPIPKGIGIFLFCSCKLMRDRIQSSSQLYPSKKSRASPASSTQRLHGIILFGRIS